MVRSESLCDAAGGIPRHGITRRGSNNDCLSTLWREVISLAGVARSFSKASSYRNFQCRHRDAMPDLEARTLDMQRNDVNAAAVNGKEAAYFGVPWEDAYGTARPQCASNLIGVPRLAFPEQLIEITFKAMLSGAEAKPR